MELDAVDGQLAMREAHDQPVLGLRADRKVGRAGLAPHDERMVARRLERAVEAAKHQADFCGGKAKSQNGYEGKRAGLSAPCEIAWGDPERTIGFIPERVLIERNFGAQQNLIPRGEML